MLRIDRGLVPTMARAPTLAEWELDLLRSIENVVRLGHVRAVRTGEIELDGGTVEIARDALVVHCAGAGLRDDRRCRSGVRTASRPADPERLPLLRRGARRVRRSDRDADEEKNRLCPSTPYGNSPHLGPDDGARRRATASFGSEADIHGWAQDCLLNPARVAPEHRERPDLLDAQQGSPSTPRRE